MMPAKFRSTTNSGISIETPKISSIRISKEKKRPKSTRLSTFFGTKEISTVRPLGST